jgi:hypothetical protein
MVRSVLETCAVQNNIYFGTRVVINV